MAQKATAVDRNRASRIRKRIKRGTAKPEDRAWLANYESERNAYRKANPSIPPHQRNKPATPNEQPPAPIEQQRSAPPRVEQGVSAPVNAGQPVMSAPAEQARNEVQKGYASIPFMNAPGGMGVEGEASAEGMPAPAFGVPLGMAAPGPTCNIPECPACRSENGGGQLCEATGKRVWPPISMESAKMLASTILFLIGAGIKLFRKDKHFVTPNEHEINMFATGIREVQIRRASWIGAGDDIMMVMIGLGAYGRRALNEPPPAPEKGTGEP